MRTMAVAALSLFVLLIVAGPAQAQRAGLRDPFSPLVSESTDDATSTAPTTTTVGPTTITTQEPATDDLPTTGRSATTWLVVAYLLCACGAAALVLTGAGRTALVPRPGSAD